MDYGEIEEVLGGILGEEIAFETMVRNAMEGETIVSLSEWLQILGKVLIGQMHAQGQALASLGMLLILAAVLSVIAKAFRNKQISEMVFLVISLLLFMTLMKSFGVCFDITESVIRDLVDFMKVLMPAYLMAAAMGAYRTSAVVYYEGFLFLIYYLQRFVAIVLLPAIRAYVLIGMVGTLGKEELFAKGRSSLKNLILFSLKAMISITAGLQMIQGMITPAK